MAARATFALKAGAWVRRIRLAIVAPDLRHSRRSQAELPLIDLSEFGRPPLLSLKTSAQNSPNPQEPVQGGGNWREAPSDRLGRPQPFEEHSYANGGHGG